MIAKIMKVIKDEEKPLSDKQWEDLCWELMAERDKERNPERRIPVSSTLRAVCENIAGWWPVIASRRDKEGLQMKDAFVNLISVSPKQCRNLSHESISAIFGHQLGDRSAYRKRVDRGISFIRKECTDVFVPRHADRNGRYCIILFEFFCIIN